MKNEELKIDDLDIIGYADALSEELVPRVVTPIYRLRIDPRKIFMPPFQAEVDRLTNASESTPSDFTNAVEREQATQIETPIKADSNYLLWIDQDFKSHYHLDAEVHAYMRCFAKEYSRKARKSVHEGRFGEALKLAQWALAANERCLDAVLTKALVHSMMGNDDRVQLLAKIAAVISPDIDFLSWIDFQTRSLRRDRLNSTWIWLTINIRKISTSLRKIDLLENSPVDQARLTTAWTNRVMDIRAVQSEALRAMSRSRGFSVK